MQRDNDGSDGEGEAPPERRAPLVEIALTQAIRWARATPGDDLAVAVGEGPAWTADAIAVLGRTVAVLVNSMREALGDVQTMYPAVRRSPYAEGLDALDEALEDLEQMRRDLWTAYSELKDAPNSETWEHLQRVNGMPRGTVADGRVKPR